MNVQPHGAPPGLGPGDGAARARLPLLRRLRRAAVRARRAAATPATRVNDGVDFVPTKPFYLLGQHFSRDRRGGPDRRADPRVRSSSAGCRACSGSASASSSSARCTTSRRWSRPCATRASRIAEIVRATSGPRAGVAMMAFIWVALIYVIVAFADITASTFVSATRSSRGCAFTFNPGGAVAAASVLYLALAIVMGLVERLLEAAALAADGHLRARSRSARSGSGTQLSTVLVLGRARPGRSLILGYCFVASLTAGLGAAAAARLPRRLRPLPGARASAWSASSSAAIPIAAAGVQGASQAPGAIGRALPVPLRDDRLRRVLGLPRARLLGHDVEADREGDALPPGRLRRDAARGVRGADRARHGHDRRRASELAGKAPGAIYGAGLGRFLDRGHRRGAPALRRPPSARWRSRPSSSTRSTSRRGSAATSCRSSSGWNGRGGGDRRDRAHRAACRCVFVLAAPARARWHSLLDALRHVATSSSRRSRCSA